MGKGRTEAGQFAVMEFEHKKADGTILSRGKRIIDLLGRRRITEKGVFQNKLYERILTQKGEVLYESTGNILVDAFKKLQVIFFERR